MRELKLECGARVIHRCQCGCEHPAKVGYVPREGQGERLGLILENGRRVLAYPVRVREVQPC